MDFPYAHLLKIRTNNVIERLNREIRRQTRVVGTFPDGNPSVNAGLCPAHVASTTWGTKRYMSMKHLDAISSDESGFIAGYQNGKSNLVKFLTAPAKCWRLY